MTGIATYGWSVVAVPLVIAVLAATAGRVLGTRVAALAALAPAWVFAVGVAASARVLAGEEGAIASGSVEWLGAGLTVGWAIDGLTALMLLVVGLVAFLVVVFSRGYLGPGEALPRYFAVLALFTGAMSALLVADGFLGLFIGWELVGVCSYLLIGYWFTRPEASTAAVKAFLTTRVGDMGLLLALALLWREVGDLSYTAVFAAVPGMEASTVSTIGLLLLVGAVGKSAQFPLHIWLPDAMEGPTPVSALIHAATMVAAGVFLLARAWPVVGASADVQTIILVLGGFTAIAAAGSAGAQRDIKKVLAYSTISQLGFMFAAIGAGAWVVAMFHLVTHAAFKALLFLGAGSVIHATGTQRLDAMGGLLKKMPLTAGTWFVGAAALAGIPPLSGFFSKDEVLHTVVGADLGWGVMLFAASTLTAFYITRTTVLVFFGSYRGEGVPHEGGWDLRVPLVVLAAFAAALGFAGGPIAELAGGHHGEIDVLVASIATALAVLGIAVGAVSGIRPKQGADVTKLAFVGPLRWARNGWGFDEIVRQTVTRPACATARVLDRVVDRGVVDRSVEGVGALARLVGRGYSALQSGDTQWYTTLLGAGTVALLALVAYLGRGV